MKRSIGSLVILGAMAWICWALSSEIKAQGASPNLETGEKLYEIHCSSCHGLSGEGDGLYAHYLSPKPRNFTKGVFKIKSTLTGPPTDQDLLKVISNGMPGSGMRGWESTLSQEEILLIMAYIKTFSKAFEEPTSQPILIGPEPPMTSESIAGGRKIYEKMRCAFCHGDLGHGDGPSANTLKDDEDRPIRPNDFSLEIFKGGSSNADIFTRFTVGMLGTPMPSYAAILGENEQWQLVHYIKSLSPQSQPTTEERGKTIFIKYGCAGCHGENGRGGFKNPNAQTAEQVPALSYVAEGYTQDELKEKILRGVPIVEKLDPKGPPPPITMPSWEGKISPEELDELVKYLISLQPKEEEEAW